MKRSIILYGLALALLVFLLKVMEYQYLVRDLSLEFYLAILATFFIALGAWVGLRITRSRRLHFLSSHEFKANETALKRTGISSREFEVLMLMSRGNSNQEIADQLFLSLNTVKTHSSNLFIKLDVKRRTQAVHRAKELQLIP